MKTGGILLFLLFLSGQVAAQNHFSFTIHGKISDHTGAPLPYAHVRIDSLSLFTSADAEGSYTLKQVPEGKHKITVQSFGFKMQSRSISGKRNETLQLEFSLQEEVHSMDEVVIAVKSEKEKLENSAKAVDVIDTKEARLKSADMGEVLAQTQGVSVRRSGGLGSGTRFSLNGLSGDQVRFFLDGIPLEYSGYTFGISTVPLNLVDRIEIYKGVVPIQFGADALGGAVNIASPKLRYGFSGSASYQTGSFGTHRVTLDVKYLDDSTGLFVSGGGFFDYAKNDYKVEMDLPNEKGKVRPTDIRRFHDAYNAHGINLTLGIKDKSWARELSIKGFYADYTKEVQHNISMEGIFYGDVMNLKKSAGANLVYRQDFGEKVSIHTIAGYGYSERQAIDTSHRAYDYYGNCIRVKNIPGEIVRNVSGSRAMHQYTWDQNTYSRILGTWEIARSHTLRFSIAPTYTYRTGKEKFANTYDPDAAIGRMLSWVNGIEYEVNALSDKLQNIFFVKDYTQKVSIEEPMPDLPYPLVTKRNVHYYGLGNGLRFQFTSRLSMKTSYEYATRLPRPDELFGDGQFTANNLQLKPERSHNLNLELTYKNQPESKSRWFVQPNFFLRKASDFIFFQIGTNDRDNVYKNLADAVSTGMEISGGWTSPEDKFTVTVNSTYQYYYNNSREGDYKLQRFDRMPNIPYFFTNGSASYSFKNVFRNNSQLNPFWTMRYVHRFYKSWESAGLIQEEFKDEIPNQHLHGIGLTYRLLFENYTWALTGEIQNILNKKIYDFYGVQKPGRAFYVKLTMQF